jgi:tripartite-type tricarboxylate transporter receptor subunit TctC
LWRARFWTDPSTDYAYIGRSVFNPQTISVNKDSPFHTFEELTEYAKAHPDELIYADTGVTGFKIAFGAVDGHRIRHPFPPVFSRRRQGQHRALMGGHVDVAMNATSAIIPYVESGDLRPLAFRRARRSATALLPDVPTFMELAMNRLSRVPRTFLSSVRQPDHALIVARLREAYDAMMKNPEFLAQAKKSSLEVNLCQTPQNSRKKKRSCSPFLGILAMIKS